MSINVLTPIDQITDQKELANELVKCTKSPVYFAERFLGLDDIYDYNKAFLDCMERLIVYRTGRQIGKTTNSAIKAIFLGYFAPLFVSNLREGYANAIITSISKDQAALIFQKISGFIHKSHVLKNAIIRETKTEIYLTWFNGEGHTKFIVRPVGEKGLGARGFTTHIAIIDEAGYMPEDVFDAVLPSVMTTKGYVLITSTPKLRSGYFFNATEKSHTIYRKGIPQPCLDLDGNPKDKITNPWVQFHTSSLDNPDSANDPVILGILGGSKARVKTEVNGEFLDGGNALISADLMSDALEIIKPKPKFAYYDLGVDTSGKGKDETVLITVGVTPKGQCFPVDTYTELTTEQPALIREIERLNRVYGYSSIYIDSTGIGDTLLDLCQRSDQDLPVTGVNFKSDKTKLYVNLERLFEERLINLSWMLDEDKEQLISQISYMHWDYGLHKDQEPRVRSDSDDDYPDALALAVFGQDVNDYTQDISNFW